MFCEGCGSQIREGTKFCSKCGRPVKGIPGKSPVTVETVKPNRPKKSNGPLIVMVGLLAVLAVAVAVLAIVFFLGDRDGSKQDDGGKNDHAVEATAEEDEEESEDGRKTTEDQEPESDAADRKIDDQAVSVQDSKNDTDELAWKGGEEEDGEDKDKKKKKKEKNKEDVDALFRGGDSDYILPDSSERRLTAYDLEEIADDAWLLRVARNEIYARHHRLFEDENLRAYFEGKDWYDGYIEGDDFTDDMLSDVERDNLILIKEIEAALQQ